MIRLPSARAMMWALAIAAAPAGPLSAHTTCADVLDFAQFGVPTSMGVQVSSSDPSVLFTGPVAQSEVSAALLVALELSLGRPDQLRRAAEWTIQSGSRSASTTTEIVRDDGLSINGLDAHLMAEVLRTPTKQSPRFFADLGVRIDDRVAVVIVTDTLPRQDLAPVVEVARVVAAMIEPLGTE